MLTVENVTKQYKSTLVLDQVSFTLQNGFYGLLGPNGAGKTTLMRILTGILMPDCGRVLCDGVEIHALGESFRDLLGYLPQQFSMYEDFSGEKFLQYVCDLKGMDRAVARRRIPECLHIVGMEGEEKKKIRKLSGGMRRRIGIAQALLNDPKILVLDEPTSGLDPSERIRLRNHLLELSKDRIVLLSTHIVADLEAAADQLLLLKKGRLIASGQPADLLRELQGRVFTFLCSDNELPSVQSRFIISSISREGTQNRVRLVTDAPPQGAEEAFPRLEDLYLSCYAEEEEL